MRPRWEAMALVLPALTFHPDRSPGSPPEGEGALPPFRVSLEDGLSGSAPLFSPGKLDLLSRFSEDVNEYNFILWSPVFKGGAGLVDPEVAADTQYIGGFVRPLAPWPHTGDLILGAQAVDTTASRTDHEFQGEYRLPFGLGIGGGHVERTNRQADITFAKLTFRHELVAGWRYILELQAQEIADEYSPGGYAALYDDVFMFVYGNDGEQWRATFGLLVPEDFDLLGLRPAFEALYVDNTIGELDGTKFLFVNATLKYRGGFLSHPVRLGRAMGPQGLEFANPLAFLSPTWNRQLNVWEIGTVADFRVSRTELPNGSTSERYDALVFPFQLDPVTNLLDYLFVGGFYARSAQGDSPGILGGLSGKVAFLDVYVEVEYETEPRETRAVLGIIEPF